MAQVEKEKKILSSKDFPTEDSSEKKPVLNFFDIDSNTNPIKDAWRHPVGKVVIVSGVSVLLIYGSGYLLRLLAWWREGYNQFRDSGNPPTGSPPKA